MSDSGRTPSRRTVRDSAKMSRSVTRASERLSTRTDGSARTSATGRTRASVDFGEFDDFGEFAEFAESDGSVQTGTARSGAGASRKSASFGDFSAGDADADEASRTRADSFGEFDAFDTAQDDTVRAYAAWLNPASDAAGESADEKPVSEAGETEMPDDAAPVRTSVRLRDAAHARAASGASAPAARPSVAASGSRASHTSGASRTSARASTHTSRTSAHTSRTSDRASASDASAPVFGEHSDWTLTPGTGIAAYSVEASREKAAAQKAQRRKRARAIVIGVFGVILVGFLVLTGFLARERWWTYDDVEDIRGTWVVQSEEALGNDVATIRITDRAIVLDINTTYVYTLNTKKKTIDFAFPPMDLTGQGHYRFSADRTQLVIVDGKYGWFSTCTSDFWWQVRSWWAKTTGGAEPALGPEENATWLVRMDVAEPATSASADDSAAAPEGDSDGDGEGEGEGEAPAEVA